MSAFTLLEVLITLVILSTGIVLVLRAFETSLVALGEARDTVWAAQVLREKQAELSRLAMEKNVTALSYAAGSVDTPAGRFRWEWKGAMLESVPAELARSIDPVELREMNFLVVKEETGRELSAATYVRTGGARSEGGAKP